jgi:hypothetical protein
MRLYAQAARQGASSARQVADRFHLVQKNLRLAIEQQLTAWALDDLDLHRRPASGWSDRSPWFNQVETWFSILQGQSLNGASFITVEQL